LHDLVDREFNQVVGALRSGVANGVAQHDGAGAAADGGGVEALDGSGVGPDGVFGDVHRGQVVLDGEPDGFLRGALEMIDSPVFDEAANRAGAEESGSFDGDADALGDFGDGANVGFDGARGGVGANLHAIGGDFASEGFGVGNGAGTGAGKADVQRFDAQRFHEVEDFDFFFDAGVVHGGILQAVAEGFVV